MPKSSKRGSDGSWSDASNVQSEWLAISDIDESWVTEHLKEDEFPIVSALWHMKDVLEFHKKHDYIFQDNFLMQGLACNTAFDLLKLLKQTRHERFTDFICPSVLNAARIELAAQLFCNYKIPRIAVSNYIDKLLSSELGLELLGDAQRQFRCELPELIKANLHDMRKKAVEMMRKAYPQGDYPNRLSEGEMIDKYYNLLKMKLAKKSLFTILSAHYSDCFIEDLQVMSFDLKPICKPSENADLCILGLDGDNHNTLIREMLDEHTLVIEDFIVIALDQYRPIIFNFSSDIDSNFDAIRTQHTAHLIKERVRALINQKCKMQERPNVILDANVIDKKWYKLFFCDSKALTHTKRSEGVMAIKVTCSDDLKHAIEKGYEVESLDSNDEDEFNEIYTEALALNNFIGRLPQGYDIEFIDPASNDKRPWANFNTNDKQGSSFLNQVKLTG